MSKKIVPYVLLSLLLGALSGCGYLIDWGKGNFNQGTNLDKQTASAQKNIRSKTVYDQFTMRGMFDALWLSDDVLSIYAKLHTRRFGKSNKQRKEFLHRQLEENKKYISFYVLTPYEIPLGNESGQWGVFLYINGYSFIPMELKIIELSPEFMAIFGKQFNRFKIAYLVKFGAKDIEEKPLITKNTKKIGLYFRTNDKEAQLTWALDVTNKEMQKKRKRKAKTSRKQ